jgi:surfeit locus 1 family protein
MSSVRTTMRASMSDLSENPGQYSAGPPQGAADLRARALPALALVALTPLLIGLGLWQLERAREKGELIAAYEEGGGEALALDAALARGLDAALYRRVALTGRYLGARQFLLDGQVEAGQAGYDVLTPFVLADGGGTILVDRGFVAQGPAREPLADLAVAGGERQVTGRLARLPRAGLRLGPVGEGAGQSWPRAMLYPERAELESALGQPLLEPLVLLDPQEPGGYARQWRVSEIPPERHVAYALQWFAFAATLVAISAVLWARRRRKI